MGRPSKYSPEFREEAVRLYREGDQTIVATARRLGLHPESFRKWVRQAEVDAGDKPGTTRAEHAEIVRLKRELRRVEEEKLILQKAAAYFARETDRR
jgi:transposase